MSKNTSRPGFRIEGIINTAQKILEDKTTLLDGLVAEHENLTEEKKKVSADYLEALRQNGILLCVIILKTIVNHQIIKPKVENADAVISRIEDRNDNLQACVKQLEQQISLLALPGRVHSKITDFEEQTEKYKQNYLDIKEYCIAENVIGSLDKMTLQIKGKEKENETLDQEFASLVADYNKCVEEGFSKLTEIPCEKFNLAVSTLKMIEDENAKAKAYLQELKGKQLSS